MITLSHNPSFIGNHITLHVCLVLEDPLAPYGQKEIAKKKARYGLSILLVRSPPNSLFDCVWNGKTMIQYIYMFELEFKQPFCYD